MRQTHLFCNQHTIFGPGCLSQLKTLLLAAPLPTLVFINRSFAAGEYWPLLQSETGDLIAGVITVSHEASPQELDEWVQKWRNRAKRVLAIGGGSVLDAAKAFSTLCRHPLPAIRYLEKVGDTPLSGERLPLIAVPTTAGTGSEVTMNAVVTDQHHYRLKASLRHPALVPDIALLDPQLLNNTPATILASCAIDAFTHLFEAWLSSESSVFSRSFSLQGMQLFVAAWPALTQPDEQGECAREKMMMASWLGGLSLSMAGLGVIHGLAGETGALMPWHHGEVCGRLLLPFLGLCEQIKDPRQQRLLDELWQGLFPDRPPENTARQLADWLRERAPYDLWQSPPALPVAQCHEILSKAGSKNSLIKYSPQQMLFMLSESWPVEG